MRYTPTLLPQLIDAVANTINENADTVTALDQAIGDGDHVVNLQRGIHAVQNESDKLSQLDWLAAWQRIGMILMSTVGGASGSLLGTLFVNMSKAGRDKPLTPETFAEIFQAGVMAMKQRGKADVGEKTMLDVLVPVADYLTAQATQKTVADVLHELPEIALKGVESTRDMIATKGRASFLNERSIGHIDAGAKTSQLMICAIVTVLATFN